MAFPVSDTLKAISEQINKEPMLILKIEGSQYIYGSADVFENAKWDDPRITWDNEIGVTWDGEIAREDSKPYIMIKGKTTKKLAQQLLVDKGGSGSVAVMTIDLVDYKGEVAQDLSFDQIGDPLGKKAEVYMSFVGGRFPQDAIPIIRGFVDDLRYNAGSIAVSVSLSTNLLRQSTFEQYKSVLTAGIDGVTTTIPVESVGGLFESADALTTYIRIDDEIMEVTAINANDFTVIRSRLGTIAAVHNIEADVSSYYTLEGNPLDLALKLLHSKEGNEFKETDFEATNINRISVSEVVDGAIIFDYYDIEEGTGLVPGDLIQLPGSLLNTGTYTVESFVQLNTGKSYILVEESLVEETGVNYTLHIKSKYNVLPDGIGMDVDFVDTAAFEYEKSINQAAFEDYFLRLKDTISDTKEFIIKELFRPQAIYLIPRKAKTSCKVTAPPFTVEDIPLLNTRNVYDMTKIEMRRSTHQYLINNVIYRYDEGVLTEDFFAKYIDYNQEFPNLDVVGRKRLEIDSKGLQRTPQALQAIQRFSTRILNRYKFGARYIRNVKVLLSVGLRIEIGDVVFFGGEDTLLVNLQTGSRDLPVAQYEVINKDLDATKGIVVLELLETGFGIDGVFAVFSPSSLVDANSTTEKIFLDRLWDTSQYTTEREKWDRWIGLPIRVRSQDYTYDEVTTLSAYDPITNNGILVDPPLPTPPLEGYIVELAKYGEYGDTDLENMAKLTYCFTMPSTLLTAVTDDKTFDVDPTEIGKFEVGMQVNVHSTDYVRDSITRFIDDITSNTITLNDDLDITPQIGDRLEVYAFANAKGYRII